MPIGLGIGLTITRGGTPGFSLDALTLAWSTAASDNTPDFSVSGASLDVAPVDSYLQLYLSTDVDFTPPPIDILLSAVTGNPTTLTVVSALANAQYWGKVRLMSVLDVALTDWSNVVTETIAAGRQFAANGNYIISAQTRQYASNGTYIVEIAA